jgi:hypothetical protein
MTQDLNLEILNATFKIEQTQAKGNVIAGTIWLVRLGGDGDDARIALVSAFHVLDLMKGQKALVSWRTTDANGKITRTPQEINIRDSNLNPLWLTHPERDIAVMFIDVPECAKNCFVEYNDLADEKTIKNYNLGMGDELLNLGYPRGLPANGLGFAILRSGRIASHPLWPVRDFPSFLLDLTVFPGNSGGPVYVVEKFTKRDNPNNDSPRNFIVGLIAKQVSLNDESLEIGLVLHSSFIRDLLLELLEDHDDDNLV